MQSFVGAYQAYEAQPESASAQSAVTQAAQGLVGAVQTVANGIETIAGQVQTQTEADVGSLNGDLTQIGALNAQIISATAAGKPTADLEDQRDALVSDVATLVPVKATPTANGGLDLTTPDGVSLVGGTNAAQFSYTPYTLGTNGTAGTDASITLSDQPGSNLDATFASGKIGAELNIMRVDDAGAASTDPAVAPLEKVRRQLDDFVDQFYSSNPATPTAFQSAYNTGLAAGAPGLDLFVVQNQGPGGQPQPAGGDRFGFELNPLIANGTASLNQGSANAVVQALTSNSSSTALSAGDIQNFSGSISALADAIASSQTRRAAQADSNSQAATASYGATQTAYSNATGVSMDAQLADLITLQNSFNASAKVISVASSLVQTLFQSIG
jgi:flagellar hook-associated protein 1 FlgK